MNEVPVEQENEAVNLQDQTLTISSRMMLNPLCVESCGTSGTMNSGP